ncbi:MAG: 1-acyl-sn-glycerol-3-phosphate acyltransferase [Dactylosporangium sp.]|nr:1-acyl-sn-glycerol-3-phosphate acyltransferase [Dactylosporangium sp.]
MAERRLGVWRRFSVMLLKPWMLILTRRDWRGAEHIPASGGVILVANHVSHFDPLVLAHFVYETGRWPRFLAKASLFDIPVIGGLMRAVQQIPVRRGTADAAKALDAAIQAVRSGKSVIIYPEGTTTRDPDLWPMRGKTGVARLALETGAPVVPVVTWGSHRVFDPRTKKLRPRPLSPVVVAASGPLDLSGWTGQPAGVALSAQALTELTDMVMGQLRESLAEIRGVRSPPVQRRSSASGDASGGALSEGEARL